MDGSPHSIVYRPSEQTAPLSFLNNLNAFLLPRSTLRIQYSVCRCRTVLEIGRLNQDMTRYAVRSPADLLDIKVGCICLVSEKVCL